MSAAQHQLFFMNLSGKRMFVVYYSLIDTYVVLDEKYLDYIQYSFDGSLWLVA